MVQTHPNSCKTPITEDIQAFQLSVEASRHVMMTVLKSWLTVNLRVAEPAQQPSLEARQGAIRTPAGLDSNWAFLPYLLLATRFQPWQLADS